MAENHAATAAASTTVESARKWIVQNKLKAVGFMPKLSHWLHWLELLLWNIMTKMAMFCPQSLVRLVSQFGFLVFVGSLPFPLGFFRTQQVELAKNATSMVCSGELSIEKSKLKFDTT
ncbi:hypothetical protein Taro_049314 [Colocasia esculenta]|uniref:Uncharacterized protein n=1 Tax=Colocasia esculenta TaxID=4460 RepID=A0A843XAL4_COLES|nr:hypothetical protein [Colocasia esculenta]